MKKLLTLAFIAISTLFLSCSKEKTPEQLTISFAEQSVSLLIGEEKTLTPTITPAGDYSNRMAWTSSNPKAVTVNNGVIKGVANGESIIMLQIGNYKGVCKAVVNDIPVEEVILNEKEVTIEIGKTFQLQATIKPENATAGNIEWISENPSVAEVKDGLVTAIATGETNIKAKSGNKEAVCKVIVGAKKFSIQIEVSNIKAANATIKLIPSNKNAKFYYDVLPKKKYDEEKAKGEQDKEEYGIMAFDRAWCEFLAYYNQTTWQEELYNQTVTGDQNTVLMDKIGIREPETEYVVYAYGIDETCNITSEFAEYEFSTTQMDVSKNEITIQFDEINTSTGFNINILTSNADSYFVTIESKDFVGWYDDNADKFTYNDMALNLVQSVYDNNERKLPSKWLRSGNSVVSVKPPFQYGDDVDPDTFYLKTGREYYVIYFSYNLEDGRRSIVKTDQFKF